MECIRPIKAGFDRSGDLTYSIKKMSKELVTFAFPCRKCLACRLNIAREKAIRSIHEAKMHENNIFLTLTYDNDHLGDGRLTYQDFQNFMKRLREYVNRIHTNENTHKISYMVTGEYGDKLKRPHWHAIIFNYRPDDARYHYTTDQKETVFTSALISSLWGKGKTEFGSVTMDSAGYVARYAAKKLAHGNDQEHDYHPIHKTSSKRAIGRSFIEKYYKDVFSKGYIVLPNGEKTGIPRYYTDWFKKHHFEEYIEYLSSIKADAIRLAELKTAADHLEWLADCNSATGGIALKKQNVKMTILKQKFKQLQERLKL
jgi:hypothetical protein